MRLSLRFEMKPIPKLSSSTPLKAGQQVAQAAPADYWSVAPEKILAALHATRNGLQPADAEQRLKQSGLNIIRSATLPGFGSITTVCAILSLTPTAIRSSIRGTGRHLLDGARGPGIQSVRLAIPRTLSAHSILAAPKVYQYLSVALALCTMQSPGEYR